MFQNIYFVNQDNIKLHYLYGIWFYKLGLKVQVDAKKKKKNPPELFGYKYQGNLSLGDYTGEQRDKLKQGCMPLRKVKKHLRVNNAQIQYYNFEI